MSEATTPIPYGPGSSQIRDLRKLGNYDLVERIGRGGMGVVFRAVHVHLKRPVAVKVLATELVQDDDAIKRFFREIDAIGRVSHPNVVNATDAGVIDGMPFLVMEFLEGADLASVIHRCGTLSVADGCNVAHQAAEGLKAIAAHDMVHRDVKPSNLFATKDGIKLMDFGLARIMLAGDMTTAGTTFGTFDYIAPEQARDATSADLRSDIYSLGCSLYKLLAGRAPFEEEKFDSLSSKLNAHLNEPPPPIRKFNADVPEELEAMLQRMLAKSPDDRFQRVGELQESLAAFTTVGAPFEFFKSISTGIYNRPQREIETMTGNQRPTAREKRAGRRPFLLAAIGLLLLLLIGGGLAAIYSFGNSQPDNNGDETVAPDPVGTDPNSVKVEELLWMDRHPAAIWQVVENNSVVANSNKIGLLTLGECQSPNFDFSVKLTHRQAGPQAGVFFAHQSEKANGDVRMQRIWINRAGEHKTSLWRDLFQHSATGQAKSSLAAFLPLPHGAKDTIMLSISVRNNELHKVLVNGEDYSEKFIDKEDTEAYGMCHGYFGLYNLNGNTVFSGVEIDHKFPQLNDIREVRTHED